MASSRPVARGRLPLVLCPLIAAALVACAPRAPRLVPPAGEVAAVEGFGSASIAGIEAAIKGKFGFVFRAPDLGRVEAVDPIGRTAFVIIFREGRAWFVLPDRKIYAEDAAAVMMERFLGIALLPDEAVRLLSGTWTAGSPSASGGWRVERDPQGRVVRGERGELSFSAPAFFPGDGVPREVRIEGPGTSGRVKILKLNFDPPVRAEAFDTAFLGRYTAKTWEEILELLDR